ncbi:carbohydrate-binding domain-containing protein [Methyloversatilis sp.]|nr:carbohydrate-binding domain-containing protein [Methyloversatilis sp.]MDP3455040.1 carbohydrate-binding domain-containing protein [Methyloversatilis sp.]
MDIIAGDGGHDVLYGGTEDDQIWGDTRGPTNHPYYLDLFYHGNDYIDGEDGNDYLEGGGKNDVIYGGTGADTLWGDTRASNVSLASHNAMIWGDDFLVGEEGHDLIYGGGKDDTLYGGAGHDVLAGDDTSAQIVGEFNGNDYLDGGAGNDSLTGGGRNDTLYGGAGNDTLLGDDILSRVSIEFHGDDYLDGGEGDDVLIGDGGNDVLIASAGRDWLDGGEGNDQYVIDLDPLRAPSVTIGDSGISDNDVVEITSHRLQDISTVQTATNGIQISFSDGTFIGVIDGARGSISTYQFADASLNWQKFVSTYLQTPITLAGNDIAGGMGDDTLTAQNSVQGGKGNDEIYIFNTTEILLSRGDGADLVITSTSGNENTVKFLDGINPQDLLVSEYVNGAGESVLKIAYTAVDYLEVINGWAGFIESYRFSNGETLNHSDLISRIGARTIFGTASADVINGGLHDDLLVGRAGNDNIAAGAGNDTLEGGMGSDTLAGGTGSDVYHFEYGGGHDVIVDGGTDVNSIKLLGTLKADELITERIENHLVVTIDSTGDSMTISGYFDAPSSWMIVDSSGQQTAIEDVRRVGVPVQNETIEQKATREYVRYTEREHARGLMAYGYNPVGKNKFQRVENYRFTAPSGLVTESLTYSTISISHITEATESGGSQYIEMYDYVSTSQSTVKNSAFFDSTIRKNASTNLSQRFVPAEDFLPSPGTGRSVSFDSAIPVWGNQTRIENNFPVSQPGVIGFVTNTPPDPQGMKAIPGVSFRESYHNETYQTKTIEVSPSGNIQNRVTYSGPGSILGSAEDDHIAPEDRRTSIIEETAVGVFLSGRAGDDTLVGSAYSDHLFGGEGKNVLVGNTGGDTYYISRSSDGDIILDSHQGYLYLTERDDYAEILVDEDDTISFEDGITFDELDLSWQRYSPLDASAWGEDWGDTISFFVNFMDFKLDGRSLVSSATPLNVGLQFPRISNPADFFNSGDYLAAETAWGGESSFTYLGNFQQLMQNNHAIFQEGIENLRFSDGIEFDLSDVLRYMPDQSALVADSFLQHDDELYIGGLSSSATVSINNQGPLPTWLTLEDGVLSGDIPIDYAGTIVLDLAAYEDVGIGLLNRSYTIRILNPGLVHEGTETAERVQGTGREDSLSGGLGNDTLIGMSGIDEIKGGIGDDLLIGDLLTNEVFSALGTLHSSLAGHVQQSTAAPSSYNTLYGGAGNDTLVGAATGDYLDGGSGADYLIGGAGSDRLLGDSGDDVYFFRSGDGHDLILEYATSGSFDTIRFGEGITSDTIVFSSPTGSSNDLVITYGTGDSITLVNALKDERFNVERIEFDASPQWVIDLTNPTSPVWIAQPGGLNGTSGDDTIVGGTGGDLISGGLGNDWLDGGLGDDTLIGGAGDDVYGVDSALDVVTENAGEGTDTVQSSVSYALGANIENLTLTGTAAINATGNSLNNVLTGNSAANVLNGGAGADTMSGGLGDDTYVVDSSSDVVIENASAGADTVQSSVTFTLGANLENLTLTGSANVNGTGNNDHNSLTGNGGNNILSGGTGYDYLFGGAGDDTLDGGSEDDYLRGESGNDVLIGGAGFDVLNGGEGADTMSGGADDDRYIVDNVGDVIIESADDGTLDWVESYVSYTLSENVEELILLHPGGAINGTGNSLDNYLQGNSSANVLDGGAGADTMYGAAGDDTYVVDSAADMVIEVGATASSSGTDTVNASISYTLGSRLENLTLTGSASINATGNSLNNVLTGNSAANVLDGGAGADTMAGGLGDDIYIVDSASDVVTENASAGIDTVQSSVTFTLGSDVEKLVLTGTAATEGRGNALENVLSGNSAANTLYGDAAGTSGNTAPLTSLSVFARGSIALGAAPIMEVWIDGVKAQTFEVSSTTTQEYVISAANLPVTAAHRVDVVFTNDAYDGATGQDRNLYVERLRFNGRDYLTNTEQLLLDYGTGAGARDGMNITLATSGVIATNAALRFSLDGSDRLDGGAGADTLIGGTGDDMYYVDNASDSVVELSGQGLDTVKSSVSHTLAGNVENLVLTGSAIAGTGNDLANLIIGNAGNNILNGGGSTDSLRGGAGADTLIGGLGNDLLDGGAGNDTYLFSRGHGQDSVWESDTTVGNQDVMSFDSTVAYDQLWLKRVGNNLEVSVIGTTDKITVSNWYVGNQWHVEQVAASDKILVDTQVQALVDAMAAMTPPPLGQTALSAAQVSALQPVLASSWQ